MKNILICCPVYEPHAGGGGQYFPLLVKQLLSFKKIRKVVVLTEYHASKNFYSYENDTHVYRLLPQRDTKINKTKLYSIFTFFLTYLIFYTLIPILIIKHRINTIHYTRYLRVPFYFLMLILKNILKVSIILDMRTTVESDGCIKNLFGYSSMISNSKGVFNQMKLLGVPDEKHFFVPNPIEFPKRAKDNKVREILKELGLEEIHPYMLFVGQLLERKSIMEVIEAFKIFLVKNQDFYLVLVGRNMIGGMIENELKRCKNIIHIRPIEREKVTALMQEAEMIIQPSKVEGIPRVTLEALSLGKKVLLPPCVPEFVQDNALFSIQSVSVVEIFNAMKRIADTDQLPIYDLSIHNPENSKKVLLDVYSKLLASR
jgi:glycosyltransferase involved in cell wall biosynthesis